MEQKKITFDSFVRGFLAVIVVVAIIMLLNRLSAVLLPFFLAWLIAYLLFPLVKFFQYKCHMKFRILGILSTFLVVGAALTGLMILVIPPVIEEAVRVKDHMLVRISDNEKTMETIIALPDSTRFSYISLTGEHCMISNIHVDCDDIPVAEDTIPRIAEEISFIRGCPQGDVPNVQVDGWCSSFTEGI